MPAKIDSQTIASLRHFADGGDRVAQCIKAILAGTYFAEAPTIDAESVNVISVHGQIIFQDGTKRAGVVGVLIKSYPVSGAGTMAVHASGGTAKKGSGTTELWLETNADGSFRIDVTNAAAEDNLLRLETDNGEVNLVKLTYT